MACFPLHPLILSSHFNWQLTMIEKPARLLSALLLFVLICAPAHATRKTDTVSLYNGDRITGEISSMFGGILEFKTDAMGTLKIEWPEISRIESKYHYEVRLSTGDRMYGSLAEESRPGQVVLVDIFGRHEIEWLQVVEIRPIEDDFWQRLDVYLSTTFSYTKASDVRQLTINGQVNYEDEKSLNSLSGRTDFNNTAESDTSSSRLDIGRRVWRQNRSDSFRAIYGNYETNDELDLDYRVGAGGGIGRYFMDTHRTRITGIAGLQVITERFNKEDTNQDVELVLSGTLATWKFSTPELNVDLSFTLYPSITDSGRVRSDTNLRIRWELIEDLYWDVSGWASSDNQSNQGDGSTWDYAITTGIGWEL